MHKHTFLLALFGLALGCGGGPIASDDGGSTTGPDDPPATSWTSSPPPGSSSSSGVADSSTGPGGEDSSSTGGDTGEPPDPTDPTDDTAPIEPYTPCSDPGDCGGAQVCFDMLGVSVCTMLGCADDEGMCGAGATCMVTEAIAPDGVCVNTGSDQFCARECSDALVCNLDPACATAGCCVDVDTSGCPSMCDELMTIECEISPQCDASCCGKK